MGVQVPYPDSASARGPSPTAARIDMNLCVYTHKLSYTFMSHKHVRGDMCRTDTPAESCRIRDSVTLVFAHAKNTPAIWGFGPLVTRVRGRTDPLLISSGMFPCGLCACLCVTVAHRFKILYIYIYIQYLYLGYAYPMSIGGGASYTIYIYMYAIHTRNSCVRVWKPGTTCHWNRLQMSHKFLEPANVAHVKV